MDTQELANALFGASRVENTSIKSMTTTQGVAVSDSVDGKVKVKLLNAESTPLDSDATEENTVVELNTTPAVKKGDKVVVTAEGGILKTMTVTGNYGSGDKQAEDTEEARKVATNYINIDENKGITIGNMQDETLGHNTHIDADGVSIRDGETVLASFEDDEISLGKNSDSSAISMCGDYITLTKENKTLNIFSKGGLNLASFNGQIGMDTSCISLGSQQITMMVLGMDWFKFDKNGIYFKDTPVSLEGHTHTSSDFETVLYSSNTGTTSTVTLSESAANFTYLEIYYKLNVNNRGGSVKVYSPNGKYTVLSDTFWGDSNGTVQTEFLTLIISGTSITRGTEGYTKAKGSTVSTGNASTPLFYITRVVGIN